MAIHPIFRFYAELEMYKPKIWRRFEINGNKTVAELGYTLMSLFEMQASHLFGFTDNHGLEKLKDMQSRYSDEAMRKLLGKQQYDYMMSLTSVRYELPYGDDEEYDDVKTYHAGKYKLKNILDEPPRQLLFEYDYGDGWRINLTLEFCEKAEIHASELPRVLEGEGFGILEDCGGVTGLRDIAKAYKTKKGRKYKEYKEWLGIDELDLALFDVDDANFRLKKLPRIFKGCYELRREPSQRSIDLLERRSPQYTPQGQLPEYSLPR